MGPVPNAASLLLMGVDYLYHRRSRPHARHGFIPDIERASPRFPAPAADAAVLGNLPDRHPEDLAKTFQARPSVKNRSVRPATTRPRRSRRRGSHSTNDAKAKRRAHAPRHRKPCDVKNGIVFCKPQGRSHIVAPRGKAWPRRLPAHHGDLPQVLSFTRSAAALPRWPT